MASENAVPCRVGGWEVVAVPGDCYTFGCGNVVSGPIRLNQVQPGDDVEGIAEAVPLPPETEQRECNCGLGSPVMVCLANHPFCG